MICTDAIVAAGLPRWCYSGGGQLRSHHETSQCQWLCIRTHSFNRSVSASVAIHSRSNAEVLYCIHQQPARPAYHKNEKTSPSLAPVAGGGKQTAIWHALSASTTLTTPVHSAIWHLTGATIFRFPDPPGALNILNICEPAAVEGDHHLREDQWRQNASNASAGDTSRLGTRKNRLGISEVEMVTTSHKKSPKCNPMYPLVI